MKFLEIYIKMLNRAFVLIFKTIAIMIAVILFALVMGLILNFIGMIGTVILFVVLCGIVANYYL